MFAIPSPKETARQHALTEPFHQDGQSGRWDGARVIYGAS